MNITEANHVNVVLKALLRQEFGTSVEDAATQLTAAAANLADRAHAVLSAGLTYVEVVKILAAPEPLPVLENLVDLHGNPSYVLGDRVRAVFVCYEEGHVGFLANGDRPLVEVVEMLSDAAVQVVRSQGIEPPAGV